MSGKKVYPVAGLVLCISLSSRRTQNDGQDYKAADAKVSSSAGMAVSLSLIAFACAGGRRVLSAPGCISLLFPSTG